MKHQGIARGLAVCILLAWGGIADAATNVVYTGSLNIGRATHTATLLSNGKVLVVGGDNNGPLSSVELYDPLSGTWTNTGAMSNARYFHTATLLANGKVLIAGGYGNSGPTTSAELYDPATGTWKTTGAMGTARYEFTATLLPNGKVLVAGNYGVYNPGTSAELYDPATESWTPTGTMVTPRTYHEATLLADGTVLVSGGANAGGYLVSAELYNPTAGTWASTGSLNVGRQGHSAAVLTDGKILVAGGWGGGTVASTELYDPVAGTWTLTGALNYSRENFSITGLQDGKVLASGGYLNTGDISGYRLIIEIYDPATGLWKPYGSLNSIRSHHTMTSLPDGKVLITGGGAGGVLSSAELFWIDTFCSPHAAKATAVIQNGEVLWAMLTESGCGYTNPPTVFIQRGGGSGATATAVVSNGIVIGINITNAGTGYTSVPQIVIASPPFEPSVGIAFSRVNVTQHVVLGRNYVLETSTNLLSWSATGPSFNAVSENYTNEFMIGETGAFFRLREVP